MKTELLSAFKQHFQAEPSFGVRSPGRVNLIGEHIDYNDGFVMPMALEQATWLAVKPRSDRMINMVSEQFKAQAQVDLTQVECLPQSPIGEISWQDYIKGVAWALQDQFGPLNGFDAVVASDVPMGAGLSSSASFEVAIACALAKVNQLQWDPTHMARLCQKAENQWVGVNCGIMDQLVVAVGKEGHAVKLDCRSLAAQAVPLPSGASIVIMDTGTRRGLVDSKYNERRDQCEQAAKDLGVTTLREVSLDQLMAAKSKLDPIVFKRAFHVITENERVQHAAQAMQEGDADQLGRLMIDSHMSLNREFEVTNDALNVMVNTANNAPGCYGARMTGAGFGGCAVALVDEHYLDAFRVYVRKNYQQLMDIEPKLYRSQACEGCTLVAFF